MSADVAALQAEVREAITQAQRAGFGSACRVLERLIDEAIVDAPVSEDYVRGWRDALAALRAAALALAEGG